MPSVLFVCFCFMINRLWLISDILRTVECLSMVVGTCAALLVSLAEMFEEERCVQPRDVCI